MVQTAVGIDIGGTLAKLVLFVPDGFPQQDGSLIANNVGKKLFSTAWLVVFCYSSTF